MAQTDLIIPDSPTPEKLAARILAVIPARLASTRLPRKILREIAGQPMLAWVYNAALACPELNAIVVATDSEEVADLCRTRGWPFRLTSPNLPSGSDRVEAVSREIAADIYVNIQGDEPLLQPAHISALLRPFRHPHVDVSTLRVACTPENILNPNAVKVVTAPDGRALYFSRAPIPYHRDLMNVCHPDRSAAQWRDLLLPPTNAVISTEVERPPHFLSIGAAPNANPPHYWKHIGLYAYRAHALRRFTSLPPTPLEQIERLEQLRFLENNIPVHVETTTLDTIGVDTEADLRTVEAMLLQQAATRSSL